jgi:hypothetical protein
LVVGLFVAPPPVTLADNASQQTSGPCSPAIANVGGSVSIECRGVIGLTPELKAYLDEKLSPIVSRPPSQQGEPSITYDRFGRIFSRKLIDGTVFYFYYGPTKVVSSEILHSERDDQPDKITSFRWDSQNRLIWKETDDEIVKVSYDIFAEKIVRIEAISKTDGSRSWSSFSYDNHGRLTRAANSGYVEVAVEYNKAGLISSLVDKSGTTVNILYNSEGRPVLISVPSVGDIKVSYEAGEVSSVQGTAGREATLRITATYQKLLDLVSSASLGTH